MTDEERKALARYLYVVSEGTDNWDKYIEGTVLEARWLAVADAAARAFTPRPNIPERDEY